MLTEPMVAELQQRFRRSVHPKLKLRQLVKRLGRIVSTALQSLSLLI
jgi:hypothetical protein